MTDSMPSNAAMPSQEKDWLAALTYIIPILFIYMMMKKGKETMAVWHSKNAAGIIVVALALNIVVQILFSILPFTWSLTMTLVNLINLAFFVLVLYGAWQAFEGKQVHLPIITQVGQKIPLEKWFKAEGHTAPAANPAPEAPAPVVETPAPVVETATPVMEAPAPTPAPETPAPVVEAPAPAPVEEKPEATPPTPPTPPAAPSIQ
ncbi:MAG: hypothetical protein WC777_05575 [Candidatus Gracilibacteria bacterium]|jgi:uncharacterized membrane protein